MGSFEVTACLLVDGGAVTASTLRRWALCHPHFGIFICFFTYFFGAVAERLRFFMYIVLAVFIAGVIYPIFGHWVWNGINLGQKAGWLAELGFFDFAGSTVVHSVGGWCALAILLVVGPRYARFPKDRPPQTIIGANLPLSALGVILLYIGWIGFNGGSNLRLDSAV